MRFALGPIPKGVDFLKGDQDWHSIREPGPLGYQFLALPVAALLLSGLLACIWAYGNVRFHHCSMLRALLLTIICVPFHELIHAVVHPQNGRSEDTILGIWPAKLLFYAHYEGEITRARFMAILAAPWLLLSLLPLVALCTFAPGEPILAELSVGNALVAGGDILGILFIWIQVPGSARVRNLQWRTFWKEGSDT